LVIFTSEDNDLRISDGEPPKRFSKPLPPFSLKCAQRSSPWSSRPFFEVSQSTYALPKKEKRKENETKKEKKRRERRKRRRRRRKGNDVEKYIGDGNGRKGEGGEKMKWREE